MSKRLENKVAIITGGGQGIGAATAIRFAEEGAKVVICSRRMEPLEQVAKTIRDAGGECTPLSVDVSDEEAVKRLVETTVSKHGKLDIIVNNAVLMVPEMIGKHSTKGWRQNFAVSLDGAMFLMRESYKQLRANKGAVVNISSVCGLLGSMGTAGYSAAKAAMIGLTRNASIEWAPDVRVNAITPGAFLTPALEMVNPDEESQKATGKTIPLKRVGDPRECANAILFLASDEASYITGIVMPVDGGRTAELNTGAASWED
ncbi:NAD(P)-dependent dehydrogenase (short-subunit alcohol dehydrogenase family) [Litorivivens lipolytica]|uniref:NAD(P)-dependent dehydrogenase (Short-subunit alcohol dehydrogenase family) n=1 Tax=Litorivivens lipolytica TaxID=1524264 RepID=A0A7W4W548_9GAMM|nr:SDR family oxidoreductase [Litorivivens lipolytica]MBB3047666.1 NAD(P)-dependent dehydrogenase (short-subunit alcohol dehydrogenase family) [Litorivivens lipolytica]